MKKSYSKEAVLACDYHGCVLAIGELDEKSFKTKVYTPLFRERGGKCTSCQYAKFYSKDDKGNVKERSCAGKTGINKIKLGGEEASYDKITEKARELVPYL
jgi:hypothetical protein